MNCGTKMRDDSGKFIKNKKSNIDILAAIATELIKIEQNKIEKNISNITEYKNSSNETDNKYTISRKNRV